MQVSGRWTTSTRASAPHPHARHFLSGSRSSARRLGAALLTQTHFSTAASRHCRLHEPLTVSGCGRTSRHTYAEEPAPTSWRTSVWPVRSRETTRWHRRCGRRRALSHQSGRLLCLSQKAQVGPSPMLTRRSRHQGRVRRGRWPGVWRRAGSAEVTGVTPALVRTRHRTRGFERCFARAAVARSGVSPGVPARGARTRRRTARAWRVAVAPASSALRFWC